MQMQKKELTNTLSYGQAYNQLPMANSFVASDELYIKNLICLEHAKMNHESGNDEGWKESINALESQISEHERVIADWTKLNRFAGSESHSTIS